MKDRARIYVQAGAGGDGCLSFRREAHVPRGGPDGGDGGRGGDVVLVCDDSLRDLERYRRRSQFKAGRGGHGQGSLRHGRDGETLELSVPPGTQVLVESDGTRYDLVRTGQRAVVARGGPGGRGNKRFASPTHQTPRFAERGLSGDEGWLVLQLKLLADVGLVGLPNAGKSSLLARLTRAHPKVADYPFTTLEPALGTLDAGDRQLVVADIPGLIEGASAGAGLGHDFLAHVERTRLLVHVVEVEPIDASDPVANHATVERELAEHDARLAKLPRILALSKVDLIDAVRRERLQQEWEQRLGSGVPVLLTSSATRQGIDELAAALARRIPVDQEAPAALGGEEAPAAVGREQAPAALGDEEAQAPEADSEGAAQAPRPDTAARRDGSLAGEEAPAEHRLFRPAADRGYEVKRLGEKRYSVTGRGIERLVARYDLDNEDAMAYLERRLRGIGVIDALQAQGFEPGDEVEIAGIEFDLDPGV